MQGSNVFHSSLLRQPPRPLQVVPGPLEDESPLHQPADLPVYGRAVGAPLGQAQRHQEWLGALAGQVGVGLAEPKYECPVTL